ncbi:MAG: hypothetical protein K6G43_11235 [Lachnospiraceae bacterium]|nr:hypothetical protein [Lachnospiraceae bacterium]
MRKHVLILLASVIFFMIMPAFQSVAAENDIDEHNQIYEQINDALNYVSYDKETFGLRNVDFSELEVPNPVNVYEYIDGEFIQSGAIYPIVYNGHIVATANSPIEGKFCIEVGLAHMLDELNANSISLIYDSEWAYVYTGRELLPLFKLEIEDVDESSKYVSYRDTLEVDRQIDFSGIVVIDISNTYSLGYSEENYDNNRTYYSCNVSYVTQAPYNNLCWAATIACIKNYLSGTTLSAVSVNQQCLNTNVVLDVTMPLSNIAYFMQNNYSMSYTLGYSVPSGNALIANISGGYPIYGMFYWSNSSGSGYHGCTIYGVNPVSGYISVMNPSANAGPCTAVSNGSTYVFTSPLGTTMQLQNAICHSW